MAEQLRVTLMQTAASLDPAENRAALAAADPGASDLVVFPEACARDFGPADDDLGRYAEPVDGPFAVAVGELAGRLAATVVAGMFEQSGDPRRPFNTLLVRGAAEATYRKIHLYDSFGYRESDRLTAGDWKPVVVEVEGWKVGLLTCYDLRFPELARDLVTADAEVLLVPAAWLPGRTPEEHERKVTAWHTLLRARAIENVCFVVGAGQPAPRYTGRSLVAGPFGEVLAEAGPDVGVLTATLDRAALDEARTTNPSLANRRT